MWNFLFYSIMNVVNLRGSRDRMGNGFISTYMYTFSAYTTNVVSLNLAHGRVYSVITLCDKNLSVTCNRSALFSRYSGFLLQWNLPPLYYRNIVESGVKYHKLISTIILLNLSSQFKLSFHIMSVSFLQQTNAFHSQISICMNVYIMYITVLFNVWVYI